MEPLKVSVLDPWEPELGTSQFLWSIAFSRWHPPLVPRPSRLSWCLLRASPFPFLTSQRLFKHVSAILNLACFLQ